MTPVCADLGSKANPVAYDPPQPSLLRGRPLARPAVLRHRRTWRMRRRYLSGWLCVVSLLRGQRCRPASTHHSASDHRARIPHRTDRVAAYQGAQRSYAKGRTTARRSEAELDGSHSLRSCCAGIEPQRVWKAPQLRRHRSRWCRSRKCGLGVALTPFAPLLAFTLTKRVRSRGGDRSIALWPETGAPQSR